MTDSTTTTVLRLGTGLPDDPERPVTIDPGIYEAVLVDFKTDYSGYFKKGILRMRFRITEMGPYHGLIVLGWFNIEPTKNKGVVKAGWRSEVVRMYQNCFDTRLTRRDRIPIGRFKSHRLSVEVRTVSKDSHGEPLEMINRYSRVKRVLAIIE